MAQTQESARLPPLLSGLLRIKQLSQTHIEALRQIVKEDYGADLSLQEAAMIANDLVSYFDLLAKIHHRSRNEVRDVPLAQEVDRGLCS